MLMGVDIWVGREDMRITIGADAICVMELCHVYEFENRG